MHQPVRVFTIGFNQQQTLSIDIQPAIGDPAPALKLWNLCENAGASFEVTAGYYFAGCFVVNEAPSRLGALVVWVNLASVDSQLVPRLVAVTRFDIAPIDGNPTIRDPAFNLSTRCKPKARPSTKSARSVTTSRVRHAINWART